MAGVALDALLGDPRRGHPVAGFGRAAGWLEQRTYADDRARGALYTALGGSYPAVISTIIYVLATSATTGNPMLGFAAVVVGAVCAWERRATGGVLAPMLTHFVWGLIMVLALPPMFGD